MKMTATVAALAAAVIFWWCGIAQAYRPFDGTDAAVADTGDVEIELGPVEYQREEAERVLFAPDLRVNYGFRPDWEASIEGELTHALAGIFRQRPSSAISLRLKRSCAKAPYSRNRGRASQPNLTCYCRVYVTSPAPVSVLSVSFRSSGIG